jgi:hypothetical protein
MKRRILLTIWGLFFVLAWGCLAVFAQGLMRDHYTGDPVAKIDPQVRTDWISVPFHVWGKGSYDLRISSVNHDPVPVGRLFEGKMQVRIKDPDGRLVFEKLYEAGMTSHRVPNNYGDSQLALISLNAWPLRSWRLEVRVTEGDPAFTTTQTDIRLRKQRDDPGMGGLMNYAMIVPGTIFLLLAFFLSLPLLQSGNRWPLITTATMSIAFIALIVS